MGISIMLFFRFVEIRPILPFAFIWNVVPFGTLEAPITLPHGSYLGFLRPGGKGVAPRFDSSRAQ